MARKRAIIVDEDEDIVAYEHALGSGFVRVLVGFGTIMPDGSFLPAPEQNYENFLIQGSDYETLMAGTDTKPAGVFRKDDLWPFVNIGRQKAKEEHEAYINRIAPPKVKI